jgi:CheY-like chemotaxis protein
MSKHRILVVDDNEILLAVYERDLLRWGYEVAVAAGCREAMALAPAFAPHLVLIDRHMPDGDGLELARDLAHRMAPSPPKALVISASYDDEAPGDPPSVARYLPKETAPGRLRQLLAAALADERLSMVPSYHPPEAHR